MHQHATIDIFSPRLNLWNLQSATAAALLLTIEANCHCMHTVREMYIPFFYHLWFSIIFWQSIHTMLISQPSVWKWTFRYCLCTVENKNIEPEWVPGEQMWFSYFVLWCYELLLIYYSYPIAQVDVAMAQLEFPIFDLKCIDFHCDNSGSMNNIVCFN